jgi:deazaflavin-dependent oxidoreductase (nitroreductase family)
MWYNKIMGWLLRSPLHGMISGSIMLISVTGRKSGQTYTTPVNYLNIDGALFTTSQRPRKWWRNLRGGAAVTLHLRGQDQPAFSQVFEEAQEIVPLLATMLQRNPQIARYYGVRLDANRQAPAEALRQAAEKLVIIRTEMRP